MKRVLVGLLLASLFLNVLLLARYARENTPPVSPTAAHPATPGSAPAAGAPAPGADLWSELRTDDLAELAWRLREAGFPPEVMRAIVGVQVRALFAQRAEAIAPGLDRAPFWKNQPYDPRVRAALYELTREQQKMVRELVGPDAEDIVGLLQGARHFDDVAPNKLPALQALLADYDDARLAAQRSYAQGSNLADTAKRLNAIDQQHREALRALLDPRELEEFNVRNSETARKLRAGLAAFNPSEEEFRMIYKLQEEFDTRFGHFYQSPTGEQERQRFATQREMNQRIQTLLGPERGREYERSLDYGYRQTSQLVARLELPPDTAQKVWDVKKEMDSRALALRRDRDLAPAQLASQLSALAAEATARISPLLGPRGLEGYQDNGGTWLQLLAPRTPPPVAPATGKKP